MGKKRNDPEYVVICREFNRPAAKIEISVIDSGVTDNLLKKLNRHIAELGAELDKERKTENEKN